MINIVIPMAGRGERFREQGFETPKPLIEFNGKTMIEYAVESLDIRGKFIFIVYKYSEESYNIRIREILNRIVNNPIIIEIDYITDGPASSALLAKDYINNDDELIVTNCDQIMKWNVDDFLSYKNNNKFDGIVVTYESNTNKNSFIQLDENGLGIKLAEKKVISNISLNGIHYWRKGLFFINSVEKMISKNIRVNNEFYISMTYNEMINDKLLVSNYHINKCEHIAVGTPEDLKYYINNENK